MMYIDKTNRFMDFFNPKTGFYLRSNIIDKDLTDTGIDPFQRDFPSLIDLGIMGHCTNKSYCKVGCYQGTKQGPNMTLENFKNIVDQCKGKTYEFALGGAGSPNDHENFVEIVKYARENGIVPNYTTSGIGLTNQQVQATKNYCGAVAISYYDQWYTFDAITKFIEIGCKTNIHYVLGNDSIDNAIKLLKYDLFPKNINAVIFLLYKPVGCIKENNMLKYDDPRVEKFFKLIDGGAKVSHKIGLDACCIPALMNFTNNISKTHITPCDGGSFSMYITPDMFALPCSFDSTTMNFAYDLKGKTIIDAWNSKPFNKFRNYHKFGCKDCKEQSDCKAGCPIVPKINLCERKEKIYYED